MNTSTTITRAQQHERIKAEQNPWEELPRLANALRSGIGAMDAADLNTRLRWWGVYTQGDGEGAFGGAAPFFMLRVRIPNGLMTSAQAAALARLARRHGRDLLDVTVRQNLQLHWLRAEVLHDVFQTLSDVGLTSQSACGDTPRNITGCPLAGIDPEEHADASDLVRELNRALLAGADFYNLPRKFKVCITGCRQWCPNPEINDAAFTAFSRGGSVRYALRVGGGLSNTPHLAQALPVTLDPAEVVPVALGIARLFREAAELRESRGRARLKFLFLKHGWTLEQFRLALEGQTGFRLRDGEPDAPPPGGFRDHIGVHPQRPEGTFYAGISLLRGRLHADQLEAIAAAAERFGGGEVRATAMQGLIVPHVPAENVAPLRGELARHGLPIASSAFRRGTVACTGKEFCKLAVVETKGFAAQLVRELEARVPGLRETLRINVNGCPNSCGQHWIADIGLQGTRVKTAVGPADGFDVYLGGGLGQGAALARRTLGRVAAAEMAPRLAALVEFYLAERLPAEAFRFFVARIGHARLEAVLGTAPASFLPERTREMADELVPLDL